jgi:hypothetical protein
VRRNGAAGSNLVAAITAKQSRSNCKVGRYLERHEPEVVDLQHHVGELLRVDGHVVDDHAQPVPLPRRARQPEPLAVERHDEGAPDLHPQLLAVEVVLVAAQRLRALGRQQRRHQPRALAQRPLADGGGVVHEALDQRRAHVHHRQPEQRQRRVEEEQRPEGAEQRVPHRVAGLLGGGGRPVPGEELVHALGAVGGGQGRHVRQLQRRAVAAAHQRVHPRPRRAGRPRRRRVGGHVLVLAALVVASRVRRGGGAGGRRRGGDDARRAGDGEQREWEGQGQRRHRERVVREGVRNPGCEARDGGASEERRQRGRRQPVEPQRQRVRRRAEPLLVRDHRCGGQVRRALQRQERRLQGPAPSDEREDEQDAVEGGEDRGRRERDDEPGPEPHRRRRSTPPIEQRLLGGAAAAVEVAAMPLPLAPGGDELRRAEAEQDHQEHGRRGREEHALRAPGEEEERGPLPEPRAGAGGEVAGLHGDPPRRRRRGEGHAVARGSDDHCCWRQRMQRPVIGSCGLDWLRAWVGWARLEALSSSRGAELGRRSRGGWRFLFVWSR